jgi:Domain of unknown function (DUF4194)
VTDTLQTQLEARLADTSVTLHRFRQLIGRLYATGALYRPWSEEEGRLYDDASRIEPILNDYFNLAGFRLTHDRDARILRLFPPGAAEDESEEGTQEVTKRLRARVSREFAAALLALRFLYGKAVQEGNVNAQDEVTVTIEEVAQAMAGTLGLQLPRSSAERQTLFRELRMHRILRLPEESRVGMPDSFIAIQRSILSLVNEGILESVLAEHAVAPAAVEEPREGEPLGEED